MSSAIHIARGLGITAVIVTYAVLVHHANTSDAGSILGAILALAPILLIVATFACNTQSRLIGIASLLLVCIASWLAWPLIIQHTGLLFWLQDVGLMTALLFTFGHTLQKGHKPLCVHFAEIINNGALPPEHVRYAHRVTVAWVVFFAMIIITSSLLFFLAPLATWSFFVNFLTLPLVVLMFIVEFLIRHRVLTDLPTGGILDAVRAYKNHSARVR